MGTTAALLASLIRRPTSAESDGALLIRFVANGEGTAFEELVPNHSDQGNCRSHNAWKFDESGVFLIGEFYAADSALADYCPSGTANLLSFDDTEREGQPAAAKVERSFFNSGRDSIVEDTRAERVMDKAPGLFTANNFSHFQHHQVVRHVHSGNRKHSGDFGHVLRPVGQKPHNLQPFRGRKRSEHLGAAIRLKFVSGHGPFPKIRGVRQF